MYRMYGTVNQGFQDVELLASCLINVLSSAKSSNAGTWCPELVGDDRMYGTVNQGFQEAKLLASRLINVLNSEKSDNAGTWWPAQS